MKETLVTTADEVLGKKKKEKCSLDDRRNSKKMDKRRKYKRNDTEYSKCHKQI